ncbi:hypothetical protein [Niabella hirudinis]|uniref:hypothetical protein n=1 Tax=Niabella hirudinis TaxID=1285929 RepID=UPI003EBBB41B
MNVYRRFLLLLLVVLLVIWGFIISDKAFQTNFLGKRYRGIVTAIDSSYARTIEYDYSYQIIYPDSGRMDTAVVVTRARKRFFEPGSEIVFVRKNATAQLPFRVVDYAFFVLLLAGSVIVVYLLMKGSIFLFACLFFTPLQNNAQNSKRITNAIKDLYKQVKFTDQAIEYRANIQVGASSFEFYVNDVLVEYYFGNANGTFNTSAPVNNAILKSGKQKWKLILYAAYLDGKQEKDLSPNLLVDINIEGLKETPDRKGVRPVGTPAQLITLPNKEQGTGGKPLAVYEGTFEATVPYELLGWTNSEPLAKEDEKKLLQEVLAANQHYLDLFKNKDINGIREMVYKKEQETQQANFDNREGSMENDAAYTGVLDLPGAEFLPIEHYKLKIFGDGRLVALVRADFPHIDEPVVRIRYTKNGKRKIRALYGVFHKPAGSGRLEMIR